MPVLHGPRLEREGPLGRALRALGKPPCGGEPLPWKQVLSAQEGALLCAKCQVSRQELGEEGGHSYGDLTRPPHTPTPAKW